MSKIIVIDETANELPFNEAMDWVTFQQFCNDVLYNRLKITDAREYLTQGSEQQGIDIYATEGPDGKLITAQCKLERYLSPKDVDDIIELFINGEFADKSREFILCTSFDLSRHRDEEQTLQSARGKLNDIGVSLVVWDKKGLSAELRNNPVPHLVSRYFNMEIARAFYGPLFNDWVKTYRKIPKPANYNFDESYIERKLTTYHDYHEWVNNPYSLYFNDKYLKLIDLIDQKQKSRSCKLVVLSIAGFGKTFELQHIAAHYAQADQYLYPIRSYLRDYEGQSIIELLNLLNANWGYVEDNAMLLIFDGLDEMKDAHYSAFINHINQFCEARPKIKVVISTRFNFYDLVNMPLRDFEVLILHPFSQRDINSYLEVQLPDTKPQFHAQIEKSRFEEFIDNPYYLSRLVRFFRDDPSDFPKSKPELFGKILFDRFDRDNSRKADGISRAEFLRLSKKIAYCMTVLGKPSLNDEQMDRLLIGPLQMKAIKSFFLLNKNSANIGDWSFEHKNLQEYLCASFLEQLPLVKILSVITYNYDRQKVQTKFVNTLGFLFALLDKTGALFKELLDWLITNQEELLIRFERDRIPRITRVEIAKRILAHYKKENLSLFASSSFSMQELADFVQVDHQVIAFISEAIELDDGDWYAYYGIEFLAMGARGYIFKEQLNELFIKVLGNPKYKDRVYANVIQALVRLELFDQSVFEKIMAGPLNKDDEEVRYALIEYLNSADFTEDYLDFLIETMPIFDQLEQNLNRLGPSELLKKIILRSKRPASIRRVLEYVLSDWSTLAMDEQGDAKINAEEFKALMDEASKIYPQDSSVLSLALTFYVDYPAITIYGEWLNPMLDFFRNTVGLSEIFYRIYRLERPDRHIMELAGKPECDFLLQEYQDGNITHQEMIVFRNVLSNKNRELSEYFYEQLNTRFNNQFFIPDKDFDYQQHYKDYYFKNQQMLEDRELFIKEVDDIFSVLGKDPVTKTDFHNYQDYKLHKYQQSIVLGKLRKDAGKIPRSKAEIISDLENEVNWKYHKINEISNLLRKRKQEPGLVISPSLINFGEEWVIENINKLDYLHSASNNASGTVNFTHEVEFNNALFINLNLDLDDDLLLKILPSDFRGGMQYNDLGLSGIIISKIRDKTALKAAVFKYLKMGLATYVQKTLYAICEKMNYTECLPQLYSFITTHGLAGSDQIFLTGIYVALGGFIEDFKQFIVPVPLKEELSYLSWNWYLIEKFLSIEPEWIATLLKPVLTDGEQPESHQISAADFLIRLAQFEGLDYWSNFILLHGKTPFENRHDHIKAQIHLIQEDSRVIELLFRTMEPFVLADSETSRRPRNLVSEFVADLLIILVSKKPSLFKMIDAGLGGLIFKYNMPKPAYWLKRYRKEITQEYYNHQVQEFTIEEISLDFENAMQGIY